MFIALAEMAHDRAFGPFIDELHDVTAVVGDGCINAAPRRREPGKRAAPAVADDAHLGQGGQLLGGGLHVEDGSHALRVVRIAEAVRVTKPGGRLFFRDLLRPHDDSTVEHLVATYAAGANACQRKMFDDSLRAALSLDEMRELVVASGFVPDSVAATSDRHWTWDAVKL